MDIVIEDTPMPSFSNYEINPFLLFEVTLLMAHYGIENILSQFVKTPHLNILISQHVLLFKTVNLQKLITNCFEN